MTLLLSGPILLPSVSLPPKTPICPYRLFLPGLVDFSETSCLLMAYSLLAWRLWSPKEVIPLQHRLRVCLEKAEEREEIEKGEQSSHCMSLAQAGPNGE